MNKRAGRKCTHAVYETIRTTVSSIAFVPFARHTRVGSLLHGKFVRPSNKVCVCALTRMGESCCARCSRHLIGEDPKYDTDTSKYLDLLGVKHATDELLRERKQRQGQAVTRSKDRKQKIELLKKRRATWMALQSSSDR